jgi:hypothetical protein
VTLMRMRLLALAVFILAASHVLPAQSGGPASSAALERRVLAVLREALAPALPYPMSDESGSLPADEVSTAPWMVRPLASDDRQIEVLANPLNEANQARSNKAMAQIERAVEAAQQKSQAQYERAVADARRTGKSQEVDGITLADEGVAGAQIDAESHVLIEVELNKGGYRYQVASSVAPVVVPDLQGPILAWAIAGNVYRERPDTDERYSQARSYLLFGRVGQTDIKRSGLNYDLTAAGGGADAGDGSAVRSLVVRLSGNEVLIGDLVRKSDWTRVRALLEQ